MIFFILGLEGPHINVISHILKKCGLEFNQNDDETNLDEYVKNKTFEPYRRHLGENEYDLEQTYINELYGFIRNEIEISQKNIATKEFKDLICIKHLLQTPIPGKIVYVDYKYEDINEEFLQSVEESAYHKNLVQLQSFLELSKQGNWDLIHIDYKLFLTDLDYRKQILIKIIESEPVAESVLNDLYSNKTTEDPDDVEDTQFAYLVAQYNDVFASNLLSNIIENIQSENSNEDLSDDDLEQYVKNQNSKT
jgi:hypothetical protein